MASNWHVTAWPRQYDASIDSGRAVHLGGVNAVEMRRHLVHVMTNGRARSAEPALLGPCRLRWAARAVVAVSVGAH
jgi:hypothetical protein